MQSFISKVVKDVLKKNGDISQTTFVLPSQRACVYLKDEIMKSVSKTDFMPEIIPIEKYIQQVADMLLIDNIQLLFEFYSVYKKTVKKENEQPFEVFVQWATVALHDFNEIDSYLVESKSFFDDLRDIKKLNNWFENKQPSKIAIDYLEFFEQLHTLYDRLYDKLYQKKVGYQGMIYREAQNNLEYYIQSNKNKRIIIIGFNALNKSEEILFQELLNHDIAQIYWDCNTSLMDSNNEAGTFLRNYRDNWMYYRNKPFSWIEESPDFTQKNIQIIGAPKNTTQIKFAGELLSNMQDFDSTACILADENVLPLILSALPASIKGLNITMGYPLKDVQVAQLFEKIFALHLNQQKFDTKNLNKFYFKDVLSLLNDPSLNGKQPKALSYLKKCINHENRILLSSSDLQDYLKENEIAKPSLLFSILKPSKDIDELLSRCIIIIESLKEDVSKLEKEYLFRFHKIFQQLLTLNTRYGHIKDLKVLKTLFRQLLQNEKLAFQGEPLVGLQLMGMLETRALDFNTVLITSVNEGVLPSGKKENSFIPYDAKRHYGLPTYQEKDAIFSYHFQRLIQRTKNCYFLYNSEMDGYGSGEKSRFLTLLKINYPNIVEKVISPKTKAIVETEVSVEKTPELLEEIKKVFKKGISPSALGTYIANPIRFYEQKILGVKSKNEVEETIESNTMGAIIHDVLETLYIPYIGKLLDLKDINSMIQKLPKLLEMSFEKHYKYGSIGTGKNRLIAEVCKNYIVKFLKLEREALKNKDTVKILALEKKLEMNFPISGLDFPIKVHGIVDRIEERNGEIRIIDYKTGIVDKSYLTVLETEQFVSDYNYSKALQLMLYASMFVETEPISKPIVAGIIGFKSLNSGFLQLKFSRSKSEDNFISSEHVSTFMQTIAGIFSEILDPKCPFTENSNAPF